MTDNPNGLAATPSVGEPRDHAEPLVAARGISKSFGGVHALNDVTLELHGGEIHALLGENGAGKSTLVKTIAGRNQPDEGEIVLGGEVAGSTIRDAVTVVYQELTVVPALSVLDNLFLGHPMAGRLLKRRAMRPIARRHLDELGLEHVDLDAPASQLALAERQLIEIARALVRRSRVVILDEPTATLSDAEIERVFVAVRRMRESGCAIVWISHRLKEIFELADRVTVLRNGRHVSTDPIAALDPDELVTRMIGRSNLAERERATDGTTRSDGETPKARLLGLSVPGRFAPIDLSLAPGEIVGVTGQIGSGADAVVRAVAGLLPERQGTVEVDGVAVPPRGVRAALAHGVSFVSDDRARNGVFLEMSVEQNVSSMVLGRLARRGILPRGAERRAARDLAGRVALDPKRLPSAAGDLSGGNQQKVSLAKSIAPGPSLFVLSEPTRGVDVGARAEIYSHIRALAEETGAAVLLFSTDLVEVCEVCDRALTMFRGRAVRIAQRHELDEQALLRDILNPADSQEAA